MSFATEDDARLKQLDEILSELVQLRASLAAKEQNCVEIDVFQEDKSVSIGLLLSKLHRSLDIDQEALGRLETLFRSLRTAP